EIQAARISLQQRRGTLDDGAQEHVELKLPAQVEAGFVQGRQRGHALALAVEQLSVLHRQSGLAGKGRQVARMAVVVEIRLALIQGKDRDSLSLRDHGRPNPRANVRGGFYRDPAWK